MTFRIIFWYEIFCFFASFLKKSRLSLLSDRVILTLSSFNINSSGRGRKSSTILILPIGSFVYLVLFFIESSPFSPVSGPNNPDDFLAECESDSHDSFWHAANTIISIFLMTMANILENDTIWIKKSMLSRRK